MGKNFAFLNKLKTKRSIVYLLTFAMLCISLSIVCFAVSAIASQTYATVDSEYTLNQMVDFTNLRIEKDGESYDADAIIYYPSGKVLSSDKFTVDEAGKYLVQCSASVNGQTITEQKSFVVYDKLYSVSKAKSSVEYGTHSVYAQDKVGIVAKIAKGDEFVFNKPINLSAKTKNDTFISYFLTPTMLGQKDVAKIILRLTDLYDENNYIELMMTSQYSGDTAYYLANASGQKRAGLFDPQHILDAKGEDYIGFGERFVTYEGKRYWLVKEPTRFGAGSGFDMWTTCTAEQVGEKQVSLAFDYANKSLYSITPANKLITDFDNSDIYANLWKGFTTGEVILSIRGESYVQQDLGIVITDICGEDLSKNSFIPENKVDISVKGYSEVPYGMVGKTYSLFEKEVACPYYLADNLSVKTRVYLNYYCDNKVICPVINDAFVPTCKGIYTIEYSYTDAYGVMNKYLVDVLVKEQSEQGVSIEISQPSQTTFDQFSSVEVANYQIVNNSGDYKVSIQAKAPSGKVQQVEDGAFVPMENGAYLLTYEVSDYINTTEKSYQITVNRKDSPVIIEQPNLPNRLVKNCQYTFPEIYAYYDNGSGCQSVLCEIYIKNDGGVETLAQKQTKITASEYIDVIYKATANGATVEKSYRKEVIDCGYGDYKGIIKSNYFTYSDDVIFGPSTIDQSIYVYKIGSQSIGKNEVFEFINNLGAWNFEFEFKIENDNFDNLAVVLTDSVDNKQQVRMAITSINDKLSQLSVNGGANINFDAGFNLNSNFTINYANETRTLSVCGREVMLDNYTNGEKFQGFSSQKVKLSVEVNGISGQTAISMQKVNMQVIASTSKYDGVSPSVYFYGIDVNQRYEINQDIKIPVIYCADVIDIQPNLRVKVINEDGDALTSIDGILLDGSQDCSREYIVRASTYGTYYIDYMAEDFSGEYDKKSIELKVEDSAAPTITLGSYKQSAKLKSTIKIASIDMQDNCTAQSDLNLKIYVIKPDGKVMTIFKDGDFKADLKGKYTIAYYVYDQAGNLQIAKYSINVA